MSTVITDTELRWPCNLQLVSFDQEVLLGFCFCLLYFSFQIHFLVLTLIHVFSHVKVTVKVIAMLCLYFLWSNKLYRMVIIVNTLKGKQLGKVSVYARSHVSKHKILVVMVRHRCKQHVCGNNTVFTNKQMWVCLLLIWFNV